MTDISVAERRLIAALDRLDHAVDRAARRKQAYQPAQTPDGAASTADVVVSPEIAHLHDRQAATLEAMQMRLAEAHERLAGAGQEAARLAAANDDLARANRALVDAAGTGGDDGADAVRAALEAEIGALRAARAAEITQMSEILDALDRMLGVSTTPRSHSTAGRAVPRNRTLAGAAPGAGRSSPDPVDADGSEKTYGGKPVQAGGFDGVYGERPDLPDATDEERS